MRKRLLRCSIFFKGNISILIVERDSLLIKILNSWSKEAPTRDYTLNICTTLKKIDPTSSTRADTRGRLIGRSAIRRLIKRG